MINDKDNESTSLVTRDEGCRLGRLVDEATGQAKDPAQTIIQYGGRVRLPDKLVEILNKDFAPEVIWWQPDGECFAFDSNTVQEKILDVWFRGTKLSSFIRSLNRWGFRRVFYHALPDSALAFHHPSFGKNSTPEMLKQMKMSKGSSKAPHAIVASKKAEEEIMPSPGPALAFAVPSEKTNMPDSSAPASQAPSCVAAPTLLRPPTLGTERVTELAGLRNHQSLSLPSISLSNTIPSATLTDPGLLLRLLSEQRSRQLLADIQANQRMMQLVQAQQQQQQQQENAAMRMALLALTKSRQSS